MAKKRLFGNNTEPRCETCALGKRSADGNTVLCQNGGILPLDHSCRRYRYDPLKRTPRKTRPLNTFTAEDFALDAPSAADTDGSADRTPADIVAAADAILLSCETHHADAAAVSSDNTPGTAVFVPDDSLDIFADLERLAAHTADLDIAIAAVSTDADDRLLSTVPSTDIVTLTDDNAPDDNPLFLANQLIFPSEGMFDDDVPQNDLLVPGNRFDAVLTECDDADDE